MPTEIRKQRAQRIQREERDAKLLDLRAQGQTLNQIAETFGWGSTAAAAGAIRRAEQRARKHLLQAGEGARAAAVSTLKEDLIRIEKGIASGTIKEAKGAELTLKYRSEINRVNGLHRPDNNNSSAIDLATDPEIARFIEGLRAILVDYPPALSAVDRWLHDEVAGAGEPAQEGPRVLPAAVVEKDGAE